jgi:hypothetical protein
MKGHVPWSWAESLGGLRPSAGQPFRVQRILFGLVRVEPVLGDPTPDGVLGGERSP